VSTTAPPTATLATRRPGERPGSRRRRVLASVATTLLALVASLGLAGPAAAGPDEGSFIGAINAARQASGLGTLSVRSDLVASARAQAGRCKAAGELFHNPNLGGDVSGWQVIGENVGVGPAGDWSAINAAFMASPEHRANILDPDFDYVGVGTATDKQGRLWVAEVFISVAGVGPSGSGGGGSGGSGGASGPGPSASGSASSPASSVGAATPAPALTPEQVLRNKLTTARDRVRGPSAKRPGDLLRRAVDFSTVMLTLGR